MGSSQRHIEEMTGAGFEMPMVNQIEVGMMELPPRTHQLTSSIAAPLLPATADRGVLQGTRDRGSGLLPSGYGETRPPPLPAACQSGQCHSLNLEGYATHLHEKHGKDAAQIAIRWSLQHG